MTSLCQSLSQVKLNIKQIIGNLQKINDYAENEDFEIIKISTERFLNTLESLPIERFNKIVDKRQKKRHKNYLNLKKNRKTSTRSQTHPTIHEVIKPTTSKKHKQSFDDSKNIRECKRFLQNFELLEQLHLLRGSNSTESYKFAIKLRHLKSIWNCLLQDKLQEQTPTDVAIQQQWNEVLYGPPEKTYFQEKPDLGDFIRRRRVWDSYINSKYGSSIPVGWIIPPAKVNNKWSSYLLTNT